MSNRVKILPYKQRPERKKNPKPIDESATKWFFCPKCLGNLFDEAKAYVRFAPLPLDKEHPSVQCVTVHVCRGCRWVGNIVQDGIDMTPAEREASLRDRNVRTMMRAVYWEAEA